MTGAIEPMPLAFLQASWYMPWWYCAGKTRSDLTQSIAYSSYLQLTRIDIKTGSRMLGNCKNSVKILQVRSGAFLVNVGFTALDLRIDWAYSASNGLTTSKSDALLRWRDPKPISHTGFRRDMARLRRIGI